MGWFTQINAKRADFAVPHSDFTEQFRRSFTCILYLNTPEDCSGGTAFLRFMPSNSLTFDEAYARAVKDDSRIGETGLDYWPEATPEHWEPIGTVDMVPGRLLIFPSEYFLRCAPSRRFVLWFSAPDARIPDGQLRLLLRLRAVAYPWFPVCRQFEPTGTSKTWSYNCNIFGFYFSIKYIGKAFGRAIVSMYSQV